MPTFIRSVTAPILSIIILMMGNGLIMTFSTVRMQLEGATTSMIGLITASYYFGLFLASFRVDKLIEKIGHIRAFSSFAALSAALIMIQGLYVNPYAWVALRFIAGIAMAGLFISIESWLLVKSTVKTRGKILSIYMIAYYAALAAGQYLLDLADPRDLTLFCLAVILCALSIIPVCLTRTPGPVMQEPSLLKINHLFRISPLGVTASVFSGIILGAVYGLSPVYAKQIGLSVSEIANFMGVTILGGLILQWPIGELSDHFDRRKILLLTAIATVIIAILITMFGNKSPSMLLILIALFGGFSFALYPICISHACDQIEVHDTVATTGALLLAYGVGSVIGPNIAPFFMQWFGPTGLFYFYIINGIFIAAVCIARILTQPPVPEDEKLPYSNIPRTTPLVGELDPRSDTPSENPKSQTKKEETK